MRHPTRIRHSLLNIDRRKLQAIIQSLFPSSRENVFYSESKNYWAKPSMTRWRRIESVGPAFVIVLPVPPLCVRTSGMGQDCGRTLKSRLLRPGRTGSFYFCPSHRAGLGKGFQSRLAPEFWPARRSWYARRRCSYVGQILL